MKKLLSLILAVMMILTTVSCAFTSFAEDGQTLPAAEINVFDEFSFGRWPQSVVSDVDLIAALNEQDAPLTSYGFTHGAQQLVPGNVFKGIIDFGYADIDYGGERYRKVSFKQKRPVSISGAKTTSVSTYYFKWEPIRWTVCSVGEEGVTAITQRVIDAQPYNNTFSDVNWASSFMRAWLNEIFYENAFAPAEKAMLQSVNRFGCADDVSLPAIGDVSEGGMLCNYLNIGYAEGYSVLMNCNVSNSAFPNQKSVWSVAADDGSAVKYVNAVGDVFNGNTGSVYGVRPLVHFFTSQVPAESAPLSDYTLTAHTHQYTRPVLREDAIAETQSCDAPTNYHYTCAFCDAIGGETFANTDDKTYHTPVKVQSEAAFVGVTASSQYIGEYYYTCRVCGEVIKTYNDGKKAATFKQEIPHEHDMVLAKYTAPTCTSAGSRTFTCAYNCGYRQTETVGEELGHKLIKLVNHDALCTEATADSLATYYYTCAYCGTVFKTEKDGIAPQTFNYNPNHAHNNVILYYTQPTCNLPKYAVLGCSECGRESSREKLSEPAGHQYRKMTDNKPTCTATAQNEYVCQVCGYTITECLEPIAHNFVDSDEVCEEATCEHGAYYYKVCSMCGALSDTDLRYEPSTQLRHSYAAVVKPAALCTPATVNEAATYYYSCAECGIVIKDLEGYENKTFHEGVLNHEHTLEVLEHKDATCTAAGYTKYRCTKCAYIGTESIPKLGHLQGEFLESVAPTCSTKGYDRYQCARCGARFTVATAASLGHDYSILVKQTKAPTCTENAWYTRRCSRCDKVSAAREIEGTALGHDFVTVQTTEPCCNAAGTRVSECSRCKLVQTETFGEPTGVHQFELLETIPASCDARGVHVYRCAFCGTQTQSEFGTALGHDFAVEEETPASCTEEGVTRYLCTRCGEEKIETAPALGHDYELTETIEPNCGRAGVKVYKCTRCDSIQQRQFSAPIGEHQYKLVSTTEATCTERGIHLYKCQICGEYREDYFGEALGHDMVWEREPELTCTKGDTVRGTCARCGNSYSASYSALGHDYSVQTDTLLKKVNCLHHNMYALACSRCGEVSTSTEYSYEDDAPLLRHVYKQSILEKALCTPATEEEPATYYYTCSRCHTVIKDLEGYETLIFAATVLDHEHDMIPETEKTPTCTNSASNYWRCKTCRYREKRVLPALGHEKGEFVAHHEANCEQAEYNEYKCARCDLVFTEAIGEALGHDYSVIFYEVEAPTCTENGKYNMKCSRCGVVDGINVVEVENTALGHDYVLTGTTEPTCTTDGYKHYKCSRCDSAYDEKYADKMDGHNYKLVDYREPTCEQDGLKTYRCAGCGGGYEVLLPALGHDYVLTGTTEPTCSTDGYKHYKCSRCDSAFDVKYADKTGEHHYELVDYQAPGCVEAGLKTYRCAGCGGSYGVEIPALGHDYQVVTDQPATCTERSYKISKCSRCGYGESVSSPALGHDYQVSDERAPTCTQRGYRTYTCSRCEASYGESFGAKLGHDYVIDHINEPDCTADGAKVYVCTRCGAGKSESLPALGHDFVLTETIEPTCDTPGKKIYICSRCGEQKEELYGGHLVHDYVLVSKTEPTCPNNGVYIYECTVCGDRQTEILPAMGHDFSAHSITVLQEADCFHGTLYYAKCSRCGMLNAETPYEDTASKLPHTPSKVLSNEALRTAATASAPASYYYTCSRCGTVMKDLEGYENDFFYDEAPVHEHNYQLINTVAPTCTEQGVKTYRCEGCGGEYMVLTAALGHEKGAKIAERAASCTEAGYTKYRCTRCDYVFTESGHAALGHDYSKCSDVLYQSATCTADALYFAKCSRCGEILYAADTVLPKQGTALGHNPVAQMNEQALRSPAANGEPASYYYTCSRCGEVLKEDSYGYFFDQYVGASLSHYPEGSVIEFGRWPQSRVTDEALITNLKYQPVTMFEYGFGCGYLTLDNKLISPEEFETDIHIEYGDILFRGEKYRKVVISQMRVHDGYGTNDDSFDEKMAGTYFFKWEPIEWTVLDSGDGTVELLANVILDSTYSYRENYEYYLNKESDLSAVFGEMAFSTGEKQVLSGVEAVRLPLENDVLGQKRPIAMAGCEGLKAPLSDYARLLSSDENYQNDSQTVYGNWLVRSDSNQIENMSGYAFVGNDATNHSNWEYGFHLRPQLTLKGSFVPGQADDVNNYVTEHTHSFVRRALLRSACIHPESCVEDAAYYYVCSSCNAHGEAWYELDNTAYGHNPEQIKSENALKMAASERNDAQYYYTCSHCGEVLKGVTYGFFTLKGTHLGEHRYVLDKANSSGNCETPGELVYKCSICGDSYRQTITEAPGHNWVYYTREVRTPTTIEENGTYYKSYQCSRCGNTYTNRSEYFEYTCELGEMYHRFTIPISVVEPTCTKGGVSVLQCKYCDLQKTVSAPPLGHDYSATTKNGFTITEAASCDKDAVYNYSCSRCGALGEETFVDEGSALTHDFSKKIMNYKTLRTAATATEPATYYYTCMLCGGIDKRDNHYFTETTYTPSYRNTLSIGSEISFGSWPQSRVRDEELLASLNAMSVNMTSFGYRYTPTGGMFYQDIDMSYADVSFGGERYRKVSIGSYRPYALNSTPLESNSFQKQNGYVTGRSYWFKWEPVTWKVLSMDNYKATLVSSNILDAQLYSDDYEAGNMTWAESAIREWLNGSFYQNAFTAEEKLDILSDKVVTLDNPAYGTIGGMDTIDKVRLLSFEDIQNRTLGLYQAGDRIASYSDYAVAQGLAANWDTADWMTRSPSVEQSGIVLVSEEGGIVDSANTSTQLSGVRAVISISLNRGGKTADVNSDGCIDIADISLMIANIALDVDESNAQLDLNENDIIDNPDLSIMLLDENYGKVG